MVKTAQVKTKDTPETVDKEVLGRIEKCLRKARHEITTETEANAALFFSLEANGPVQCFLG